MALDRDAARKLILDRLSLSALSSWQCRCPVSCVVDIIFCSRVPYTVPYIPSPSAFGNVITSTLYHASCLLERVSRQISKDNALMDALLSSLNEAQRAAVTSEANVIQVLAPPGSGKTKTLTARVSYLITRCSYSPCDIVVCTFTKKAAVEMRIRIETLVGPSQASKLLLGTFHSVARRMLSVYGHFIGLPEKFGIADTSDQKAIIKRIIKDHRLSIDPSKALSRISAQKAKSLDCEQFAATAAKGVEEQEFTLLYREYEAALQLSSLLDYDDLLLKCAELVRTNPQCVRNVRAVLIDEFQDTNQVQFDLMNLFAQHTRTITIVGDPDQSIYGWRNAEIKNLETMKLHYPDTRVHFLEENYRSTGAILGAAQAVIDQDETRPPKKLQATHVFGEQPVLRRLPSASAEAIWLVEELQRVKALCGGLLLVSDFAILLRSASVSRHIETALGNAGLPYRMIGGTKFYDRVEIKILLDYLRVVDMPDHDAALLRVLNVPPRNLGEVTVAALQDEAKRRGCSIWALLLNSARGTAKVTTKLSAQAAKGVTEFVNVVLTCRKKISSLDKDSSPPTPADLLDHILKRLQFQIYLKKKYPDDYETRCANVAELRAQTVDLTTALNSNELDEEALPEIEGVKQRNANPSQDTLSVFLANIALSSTAQRTDVEQSQCITISTIHAAKGLEWPIVFIPACYTGIIPHSRAEDDDEERRLLYVGMTRAQAMLYLSCPCKNGQSQDTTISSFLTTGGVPDTLGSQGPNLEYYAISQLAAVLQRPCPEFKAVEDGRATIERREDDKWPLDGSVAPGDEETSLFATLGRSRRDFERRDADMKPMMSTGFVSAATITMDAVEGFSVRATTLKSTTNVKHGIDETPGEAAASRKLDRRAASTGDKRQLKREKSSVGVPDIASFFSKPAAKTRPAASPPKSDCIVRDQPARDAEHRNPTVRDQPLREQPLREITNNASRDPVPAVMHDCFSMQATHKPRSLPMARPIKTSEPASYKNEYMFLSSSPVEAKTDTKRVRLEDTENAEVVEASRPATTLHTTSMARIGRVGGTRGRTLGMGRSFVPWNARGKR